MATTAVQSWCFRAFENNDTVAGLVNDIGLNGIELCAKHVDFADAGSYDRVIAAYRDADVDIVSIGVNKITGDESVDRHSFAFARAAGATHISVTFSPDTLDRALDSASRLADEYDVRLGIHNHGGHDWLGNAAMLSHVFGRSSDRIGLCLDTAWALDAGEDPIAMVRRFGDRLHAVHVKDFVFDRAGNPEDVVVGTGNLSLHDLEQALRECRFDGALILEYEGDVDNPVPALRSCVEKLSEHEWPNPVSEAVR